MKYMVFGFQFLFKNAVYNKPQNKNLIRWSSFYFFSCDDLSCCNS